VTAADPPRRLVARETELAAIAALLAGESHAPSALVLVGEPGIGKTSLWESGVTRARSQGLRVLEARASGAETGLPCAALVDLFEGVDADDLEALPAPQLRALNVALYRSDPVAAPEPHAIALGLLSALRSLAGAGPLVVAIDDIQWLDQASEQALTYAARRLDGEDVVFLLARREGPRTALETEFRAGRAQRLAVGPTSLGATRQLLAERLGLRLPHHVLRRVYDATLGNPLFTLEVGRMLTGRDLHGLGEDVPVPEDVEEVLGTRVADLAVPVRNALLAVALDADLRAADVDRLVGAGSVDAATHEGVLVVDGDRVRAAHPLLAAAAKRQAPEGERRSLQRALAEVVTDEHRRAFHLALATTAHDEALAARVAAAADVAAARGATVLAVDLATHALRLTPTGSSAYVPHLLRLGQYLSLAGEKQRLTELLSGRVEQLPRGTPRVDAYVLLTNGVIRDNDDIMVLLDQALAEAGDDEQLRAPVLARLAINQAVIQVVDVARTKEWADRSWTAHDVDDKLLALDAMAWVRALLGESIADLVQRYEALCTDRFFLALSPERVWGQQLVWRGEVGTAREVLTSLQALAEDRAEPSSCALMRLHLCEMLLRIGDWDGAERLLDEWGDSTDSELLHWPMYERCRALLEAGRGDPVSARRWGEDAVERAERTGVRWDWLEAKRALGQAALLAKDLEGAVRDLAAVWDHVEREGVLDPGAFPVAPDLVEALVDAGSPDRASQVAERLAALARNQEHPWAAVGAQRSSALVELAVNGYGERAATALQDAATTYAALGLAFDSARTLLVLGRAQRRARNWGAVRETLERAAKAFDAIASPGWADNARSELGRVGARRAVPVGQLTDTEARVARLAANGLTNKEIAKELVVTVNTVEFHLRNAYAKLGIRSRAQLAARLLEDADPRP
jgi:DNA-binding CsgD family transcriptional regulator